MARWINCHSPPDSPWSDKSVTVHEARHPLFFLFFFEITLSIYCMPRRVFYPFFSLFFFFFHVRPHPNIIFKGPVLWTRRASCAILAQALFQCRWVRVAKYISRREECRSIHNPSSVWTCLSKRLKGRQGNTARDSSTSSVSLEASDLGK